LKKEYNAILEKMFEKKGEKAELLGNNSLTGGCGMEIILRL